MENGKFVVSLYFEIYWGVRDAAKLEEYKNNLLAKKHLDASMRATFVYVRTYFHKK